MEIINPEDFMKNRRDTKTETKLKRYLRSISEEERMKYIMECFEFQGLIHFIKALDLSMSCLTSHKYIRKILDIGLEIADAGSIRWWIDFGMKKLGFINMLKYLKQKIEDYPLGVSKSEYYVKRYRNIENDKMVNEYLNFKKLLKQKDLIRDPNMTLDKNGKEKFHSIWENE